MNNPVKVGPMAGAVCTTTPASPFDLQGIM